MAECGLVVTDYFEPTEELRGNSKHFYLILKSCSILTVLYVFQRMYYIFWDSPHTSASGRI